MVKYKLIYFKFYFRIRVGRSIEGFGLSPGITKEQRLGVEKLMINAFAKLEGDLAGTYYPLLGMEESVRQKLVDDHFLFVSGDKNLIAAGMERDWPEGRGIYHNKEKTFLTWVNEEDQLRIISMQMGKMNKQLIHSTQFYIYSDRLSFTIISQPFRRRRQGSILTTCPWYQGCSRQCQS